MRKLASVVVLLVSVTGCDLFEPAESGALVARVRAPGSGVGAAVVQVTGSGVLAIESEGASRVYDRTSGEPEVRRAVIVNPDGGVLPFRIRVEDLDAPAPAVAILSAADPSNAVFEAETDLWISLER